jgi:hypothetical protein
MTRQYSPATSTPCSFAANSLDPFALWPAFPASTAGRHTCDYYGSSAPPWQHRSATDLPADQQAAGRGGDRQDGSHVHSATVRRGRCPAMPLQHRPTYAADFGVASLPATLTGAGVPRSRGYALQPSPDPSGSSWWIVLRGFDTPVRCRYTFPSRLPNPNHLTVLARPGVVRTACHPPARSRVRAVLSFTNLLRQVGGGALSSPHG